MTAINDLNKGATGAYLRRARLQKGALIELSQRLGGSVPHIIVFQYNPETLTRQLKPWQPRRRSVEDEEEEQDEVEEPGTAQPDDPPESFTLDLELDANDALEAVRHNPVTFTAGIADRIAALEMLLYPSDQGLFSQLRSSEAGSIGTAAESAVPSPFDEEDVLERGSIPIVLFAWGPGRIVPVRLTSFSVEEQAYSPSLYPIRAKVSVGLKILTPADLQNHWDAAGKAIATAAYDYTKRQKQTLALAAQARNIDSILGMLPF